LKDISVISREKVILLAILLVAVVLRVLYLSEISKSPEFSCPQVDAGFHDYWARSLVTGNWAVAAEYDDPQIRTTPYLRPPGYPYFLAMIYLFTNSSYTAARIVQMFLGVVNCFLAFVVARKLYGRIVGLISAAIMAFYWIFIYFEGELHAPALLICLLLSLVYVLSLWLEKPVFRYSLASGLLLGLAVLIRPNVLFLLAVAVGWVFWIVRRQYRFRRFYITASGLVLGTVLIIAPVTIRNYLVAKDFVLISANAGMNLYIGNNAFTDGTFRANLPELENCGTCYDYPRLVASIEKKQGKPLKYSQVSAYFTRKAVGFIREQPLRFIKLTAKKALLFWGPAEIGNNKVIHYERKFSRVLGNIPGDFPAVVSLSIVGLSLLLLDLKKQKDKDKHFERKRQMSVLILLFIFAFFISILPFFITARYRVPVIPFLLILGAYGLYRIGRFVGARDLPKAGLWLIIAVVLYAVMRIQFVPYKANLDKWYYDRGVSYTLKGQIAAAMAQYRKALEVEPTNPLAHHNIGILLSRQGRLDEAVEHWNKAVRFKPDFADAHYCLGVTLYNQGKISQAIEHYTAVLKIRPDHARLSRSTQ